MDLRILRNFVVIVEAGSLTRAASTLHIAQPALTGQVKRLESRFGQKLLERTSSGVTPTPAGTRLYEEARQLLAAADAMRTRFAAISAELQGDVRLGVSWDLLGLLLPPLLRQVASAHPGVRVSCTSDISERIVEAVVDGQVDVGLVADPAPNTRLQRRPLASESIILSGLDPDGVVAGLTRPGAHTSGRYSIPTIHLADAVNLPILAPGVSSELRQKLDALCESMNLRPNIVHESDSPLVLEALYFNGDGYLLTSPSLVTPITGRPDLIRARVIEPDMTRNVGLAWQRGRKLSAPAQALIEMIRAEVAEMITNGRWPATHLDRDDYRYD